MSPCDPAAVKHLQGELRSLLERLQAARRGPDDAVAACMASVPSESKGGEFHWPRGFVINVASPLDIAESIVVDYRPHRSLRLAGRTKSKTAFVTFARQAGHLMMSCNADIIEEVSPESQACRGSFRWIYTVFDLALSRLEGSGLRVDSHGDADRFVLTGPLWRATVEPVLSEWDARPWCATIENMWVASELGIQEVLRRLDCVATKQPAANSAAVTPVTPAQRENVRMKWPKFRDDPRNRGKGSLYEAFDKLHGYALGTTERVVNAVKCEADRVRRKKESARSRINTRQ